MSYIKSELEEVEQNRDDLSNQVEMLQKRFEKCRLVEQDRDGALADAREWKNKYEEYFDVVDPNGTGDGRKQWRRIHLWGYY